MTKKCNTQGDFARFYHLPLRTAAAGCTSSAALAPGRALGPMVTGQDLGYPICLWMKGLQSQTRKKFAGYQFHYRLKKDFSKESSPNKLRTTDTMIVPQMMAGDDNQNKNKKKNNNDDSVAKTTTTATTRA